MFAVYHMYSVEELQLDYLVLVRTCQVDLCCLLNSCGQRHASTKVWGSVVQLKMCITDLNVAYCWTRQETTGLCCVGQYYCTMALFHGVKSECKYMRTCIYYFTDKHACFLIFYLVLVHVPIYSLDWLRFHMLVHLSQLTVHTQVYHWS